MVDTFNVSLNDTFSIEDEKSFLNNFGTPNNFKKLMEKPATQDKLKDMVDGVNLSSFVNNSLKSKEKFSNENSAKSSFFSPSASGRKICCSKPKLNPIDFSEMSPISCNTYKKNKFTPLKPIENIYCQSTPNEKENKKINSHFNLSKRTENKSIDFLTPDKKIDLNFSPNPSILRNVNRRKAEEENRKLLIEETAKENENEKIEDFNEMVNCFEEKLRKYASEYLKSGKKPTIENVAEKPTEIIPRKIENPTEKTISISPDIRAAFLARKAAIEESRKMQNKGYSTPDKVVSNASFEDNIRAYSASLKIVLSALKADKTPKSIRQTNNDNNNTNTKSALKSSTPAVTNKKKLEFVTPLTGSARTKKTVPTPLRWK